MNNEIIYVDGLYSNEVSEKAPEWILGSLSIQPMKLATWLQANQKLQNEKGYIRLIVKKSKDGKRYISVDTWKKESPAPVSDVQYSLQDIDPQPAFDLPEFN
jgi:hypothetical protein